jgi:hypothetical protein
LIVVVIFEVVAVVVTARLGVEVLWWPYLVPVASRFRWPIRVVDVRSLAVVVSFVMVAFGKGGCGVE